MDDLAVVDVDVAVDRFAANMANSLFQWNPFIQISDIHWFSSNKVFFGLKSHSTD